MKKIAGLAVAVALAMGLAACGGGSDSDTGGNGGTTPTTAATTQNASYKFAQTSQTLMTQMMTAMAGGAGGQVIKTADYTVSCTYGTEWTCTITDPSGGSCTMTGTVDASSYVFAADCSNFKADSDSTIDGSYTWTFTVNEAAFNAYSSADADALPGFGKTTDSSGCEFTEENIDGDGYCHVTETACAENNAFMTFEFKVGADGLTFTDECGTYTYGANTVLDMLACATNLQTMSDLLLTVTMNGTFNGASVNESFNIMCDFSTMS